MNFRENMSRSKEVLGAYFRQGLRELGSAFYGNGTSAQFPEYGMIATKPPSMVVEGLRGEADPAPSRNDISPSQLDAHLQQGQELADVQQEIERSAPEIARDEPEPEMG